MTVLVPTRHARKVAGIAFAAGAVVGGLFVAGLVGVADGCASTGAVVLLAGATSLFLSVELPCLRGGR